MIYATLQDMVAAFGQAELVELTNLSDPTATTINEPVLQAALANASARIDGYLGAVVSLPMPSVPQVLVGLCCDIARYFLDRSRPREVVTKRYQDAISFLRDVSRRVVNLGLDQATQPVAEEGGTQFDSPGRTFTSETLQDFRTGNGLWI